MTREDPRLVRVIFLPPVTGHVARRHECRSNAVRSRSPTHGLSATDYGFDAVLTLKCRFRGQGHSTAMVSKFPERFFPNVCWLLARGNKMLSWWHPDNVIRFRLRSSKSRAPDPSRALPRHFFPCYFLRLATSG